MNAKQLIAVVTLLTAAGSVMAQAPSAGKTRAQVIAEMKEARANGEMSVPDSQYPRLASDANKGRGKSGSKGNAPTAVQEVTSCASHQANSSIYSGA
ncbi:DUF4148 domain-containing protein [Paraherbaspirillum soli]|uniref:DUF4148 domain-containing protein n=1 Tax=Paraherbaspirillum soli TaxID=631222 RepID=A0ABW0M7H3_9BURK